MTANQTKGFGMIIDPDEAAHAGRTVEIITGDPERDGHFPQLKTGGVDCKNCDDPVPEPNPPTIGI